MKFRSLFNKLTLGVVISAILIIFSEDCSSMATGYVAANTGEIEVNAARKAVLTFNNEVSSCFSRSGILADASARGTNFLFIIALDNRNPKVLRSQLLYPEHHTMHT